jgi:TonB-linked SusC/RagA family outer membrane protein
LTMYKELKYEKMKKYYSTKYIYLWLLLLTITFPGLAQQKLFTGTINDESGKPVANAMVTVREQSATRVFTDNEGKFSITGETGQLLEVETRDQRYKSMSLEAEQIALTMNENDKLIPIGYMMERRKEEITSAIGIVTSDELTKSSVRNPANALYGKIPGLTVLQNGGTNWGNDPDIYIRGIETFPILNSSGTPLVVNTNILMMVDGFERPISSLSLEEIESVAVLKDAAALAMYGMRGANGVLLATTKRGTGKGLSINVNYDHGITQAFRLPQFLDAYGYTSAVNQARVNDGLAPLYSQPELDRFRTGSSPFLYPNNNWINESLRDFGSSNKFNVSFQEQAGAVRYYLLLNFDNEQGLLGPVKETGVNSTQIFSRNFNFRSNVDIDISKSTKLAVKLAGNLGENSRPSTSGNSESDVITAIYNTPSSAYPIKTHNPANRTVKNWGGTSTYPNNNPLALISGVGYTLQGRRELFTDIFLEQGLDKLLKGLSAEGGVSFDKSFDYRDIRVNTYQYEQLTPVLDPVTFAVKDSVSTIAGTNSTTSFTTSVPTHWRRSTFLVDLKYSKTWGDNELNSMVLFQREELVRINRYNTYRHLLAAGTVHYGKAGKYFADFSLSWNGTNLLPETDRFGFFPAVSLAWKLSNEEFLKGSTVFNDLKLRASWGLTGSDQVIQNIDKSPWAGSTGYYFGSGNTSASGNAEGRLASSPLTYETSNKTNFGIDASMFKMLDINLDLFFDKRTGILLETGGSISGVLGVSSPYSASGITTNKGIEVGMNLHHDAGDFAYHVAGQLSYSKNNIVEMNEVYRPYDYLKRTGQTIGQAFGLESKGFFADAADIATSPRQTFSIVRPGDIKYKDQNGDGIIDNYDQVPIGFNTKAPELYYSVSVGLEYKGIGIDALIQGAAHQTVYLNTPSIFVPFLSNTNISTYSDNSWTPATASTATLPRLTMSQNLNNYQANSIYLADGSYLKLRTVELYYDFSGQLLTRLKVDKVRLYVRGMNLLSIDNIDIVDPEAIGATYPTVSSYNVGIQIGF